MTSTVNCFQVEEQVMPRARRRAAPVLRVHGKVGNLKSISILKNTSLELSIISLSWCFTRHTSYGQNVMMLNIPNYKGKLGGFLVLKSGVNCAASEWSRAADAGYGDFKGKPKCRVLLNNTASKHSCLYIFFLNSYI